jgi:hypothetical protein
VHAEAVMEKFDAMKNIVLIAAMLLSAAMLT